MVTIRTYKTIYRVDFPPYWEMLDNMGRLCELLNEETSKAGFERAELNANIVEHKITGRLRTSSAESQLTLSIKALDCLAEHKKGGSETGSFHSDPVFALADHVIARLQASKVLSFERVGIRSWIVVEREGFGFERIRDHFVKRLSIVGDSIKTSFPETEDIGLVFESRNEEAVSVRVALGPYSADERAKYFSIDHEIGEGLILDVDVRQQKTEIPRFRMTEVSKRWERLSLDVATRVQDSLAQELEAI